MNQRHFSLSETADNFQSLQKQKERQLRAVGSVSSLIPLKTLSLLSQDAETIGQYVYRRKDEIGSGYSSRVYRCRSIKREGQFALKVIDIKKYSTSSLQMLENEIQILKRVQHPNILRFQNVYKNGNQCFLITQYCAEGDLLEYMTRNGRLCEKEAIAIINEVIQAVKYLLHLGIIHRDIKPANIFRSGKTWKLGDFGFAIMSETEIKTKQNVGTPLYMPLESLQRNLYSPQSDIFSVGIIFYEMMVGITPWQSKTQKELIRKMSTIPFDLPEKYKVTSSIKYLLTKMCQPNRDYRMNKEEFMELYVNNFVSLIAFNQKLKTQEPKRKPRIFSVGKFDRQPLSKPKNQMMLQKNSSKNQAKNTLKVQMRSTSKNKITDSKTYRNNSKPKQTDRQSEKIFEQKLEQKNYEILVRQLNYCRFMYYIIQNGNHLPLSNFSRGKVTLMLFKHLLKLIKQLADNKHNWFGITNWDAFRKSNKYTITHRTLRDYCDKYEKEYLIFLKKAEINVIKEVNHKLPEFTSNDPFTIPFYKKIHDFVAPYIKEGCDHLKTISHAIRQRKGDQAVARLQGLRSLIKYYRLVEMSLREFQDFSYFNSHCNIVILKNYRESKATLDDYVQIRQEVKMI